MNERSSLLVSLKKRKRKNTLKRFDIILPIYSTHDTCLPVSPLIIHQQYTVRISIHGSGDQGMQPTYVEFLLAGNPTYVGI